MASLTRSAIPAESARRLTAASPVCENRAAVTRLQRPSKRCTEVREGLKLAISLHASGLIAEEFTLRRQLAGNLRIEVHSHSDSGSLSAIEFSYIPKYLFYIVQDSIGLQRVERGDGSHETSWQELIKNSARATVEAPAAGDCVDMHWFIQWTNGITFVRTGQRRD